MTPLHPLAALAAGAVLGLTALTAPNTTTPQDDALRCRSDCVSALPAMPSIGEIAPADRVMLIQRPGLYGLGEPPEGDAYAILDGQIVRVGQDDGRLRSVLRPMPNPRRD